MKIDVMVFVTTNATGEVTSIQAHSQGVDYRPVTQSIANGVHKSTFRIEGEIDTTPALGINVLEVLRVADRVGG